MVVAVIVTTAVVGLQVVTTVPAAAVAELVPVFGTFSSDSNVAEKNASVTCPAAAPRIVGGGFVIDDHGQRQVFARISRPLPRPNGEDGWDVIAVAPPGFVGTFSVRAIAVCARTAGVPGHQVVPGDVVRNDPASATQETVAVCPSGKRVIGVGGAVFNGGHAVGLSTVRAAGPRGISRLYAHDRFVDSDGVWNMQAYAICMTTNDTREPTVAAVPGSTASILCSDRPNLFVHGPGGGSWTGTGLIHRIEPSANLKQTTVITTPGSTVRFPQDRGGMDYEDHVSCPRSDDSSTGSSVRERSGSSARRTNLSPR